MRDLSRYPITTEEILNCLRRLANEINKEEKVGDMRPMLLQTAANIIEKIDEGIKG